MWTDSLSNAAAVFMVAEDDGQVSDPVRSRPSDGWHRTAPRLISVTCHGPILRTNGSLIRARGGAGKPGVVPKGSPEVGPGRAAKRLRKIKGTGAKKR